MHNKMLKKYLVAILIPALLSCGAPARKLTSMSKQKTYNLTAYQAADIDWTCQNMPLVGIDSTEINGTLLGWDESGFIIENGNGTDTLAYEQLQNYVLLDAGRHYGDVCGIMGIGGGYAFFAASIYLLGSATQDADQGDDYNAQHTDGLNPLVFLAGIIGVGMIFGGGYLGNEIGKNIVKYDKFYIDHEDFKSHPYFYKPDETKSISRDQL